MSVEGNTQGTLEHNKSLLKRALLAITCLQQSEEGSQQERERMPGPSARISHHSQLQGKSRFL